MFKKKIKMLNSSKGFTLVELIVVIAILGILAAVLIPQFTGFQAKAKSTQVLVEAKQFATAADGYLVEHPELAAIDATAEGEILDIAGDDVSGTLSDYSIDGGHVLFQYVQTIKIGGVDTDFTAVRGADGNFTITW
jgi:type IV pilus assembly protein PilA